MGLTRKLPLILRELVNSRSISEKRGGERGSDGKGDSKGRTILTTRTILINREVSAKEELR